MKLRWNYSRLLTVVFLVSTIWVDPSQGAQSSSHITFDRTEEGVIHFTTPAGMKPISPMKTNISDLFYIGSMQSSDGGYPYFLFSGKPCKECLDDKVIYSVRPNGNKPSSFVYPGKILDPDNRSLLFEARAFYGKCLPGRGDLYISFQNEKEAKGKGMVASVFVAEAGKDYLNEVFLEDGRVSRKRRRAHRSRLPSIKRTLQMVHNKSCVEIFGRNRLMLAKPLDLHPRSDANLDTGDDTE